jgi:hypothetical protein
MLKECGISLLVIAMRARVNGRPNGKMFTGLVGIGRVTSRISPQPGTEVLPKNIMVAGLAC